MTAPPPPPQFAKKSTAPPPFAPSPGKFPPPTSKGIAAPFNPNIIPTPSSSVGPKAAMLAPPSSSQNTGNVKSNVGMPLRAAPQIPSSSSNVKKMPPSSSSTGFPPSPSFNKQPGKMPPTLLAATTGGAPPSNKMMMGPTTATTRPSGGPSPSPSPASANVAVSSQPPMRTAPSTTTTTVNSNAPPMKKMMMPQPQSNQTSTSTTPKNVAANPKMMMPKPAAVANNTTTTTTPQNQQATISSARSSTSIPAPRQTMVNQLQQSQQQPTKQMMPQPNTTNQHQHHFDPKPYSLSPNATSAHQHQHQHQQQIPQKATSTTTAAPPMNTNKMMMKKPMTPTNSTTHQQQNVLSSSARENSLTRSGSSSAETMLPGHAVSKAEAEKAAMVGNAPLVLPPCPVSFCVGANGQVVTVSGGNIQSESLYSILSNSSYEVGSNYANSARAVPNALEISSSSSNPDVVANCIQEIGGNSSPLTGLMKHFVNGPLPTTANTNTNTSNDQASSSAAAGANYWMKEIMSTYVPLVEQFTNGEQPQSPLVSSSSSSPQHNNTSSSNEYGSRQASSMMMSTASSSTTHQQQQNTDGALSFGQTNANTNANAATSQQQDDINNASGNTTPATSSFHPAAASNSSSSSQNQKEKEHASEQLQQFIIAGDRGKAVQVALESGLYSEALLISMLCEKEIYLKAVQSFIEHNISRTSPLGQAFMLFNEIPLAGPEALAPHVTQWAHHLKMLLCNYSANGLAEGVENWSNALLQAGMIDEAHACILLLQQSPAWTAANSNSFISDSLRNRIQLIGGVYKRQSCRRAFLHFRSLFLSDAHEYSKQRINEKFVRGQLVPFKLAHAMLHQELGLLEKATSYAELVAKILAQSGQKVKVDKSNSSTIPTTLLHLTELVRHALMNHKQRDGVKSDSTSSGGAGSGGILGWFGFGGAKSDTSNVNATTTNVVNRSQSTPSSAATNISAQQPPPLSHSNMMTTPSSTDVNNNTSSTTAAAAQPPSSTATQQQQPAAAAVTTSSSGGGLFSKIGGFFSRRAKSEDPNKPKEMILNSEAVPEWDPITKSYKFPKTAEELAAEEKTKAGPPKMNLGMKKPGSAPPQKQKYADMFNA